MVFSLSSLSAAAFSFEPTFKKKPSFIQRMTEICAPTPAQVVTAITNHYMAPTGNDANAGMLSAPYATVTKSISVAAPDDTIYLRGGTYTHAATIGVSKSGSSNSRAVCSLTPEKRLCLIFW